MKLRKWVSLVVIALVALFLVSMVGTVFVVEVPFLVVFGWAGFLRDVVPQVRVSLPALATAALVLLAAGVGVHRVLAWWWRETRKDAWRPRWSALVMLAVLVLFVSGMSVLGVGHHVGWLWNNPGPTLQSSWTAYLASRRTGSLCAQLRRQEGPAWTRATLTEELAAPAWNKLRETHHVVMLFSPLRVLMFHRDPAELPSHPPQLCTPGGALEPTTQPLDELLLAARLPAPL
jgi:hypothetical protein